MILKERFLHLEARQEYPSNFLAHEWTKPKTNKKRKSKSKRWSDGETVAEKAR
ncbi:conserved hypothetical protein [Ricinus communis]|uniref:Uncharacterized protein n=1 Tax=Ricinus communis TaxID=3988 RepID=B9RAG0_RICCO|nr:conserved hypothetical protein [Ricinus communis]